MKELTSPCFAIESQGRRHPESDNLIPMREISATDAARGFSAVLDAVEHGGETFVVTRSGRCIARIAPAPGASGAAIKNLLNRHRIGSGWSDEVSELRAGGQTQERTWPD